MKALELHTSQSLENLRLSERPRPKPDPNDVIVEMKAATLNYRDIIYLTGMMGYGADFPLPLTPLSDGAGIVVETGAAVTRVKKGDRVAPLFYQDWRSGPITREASASTLVGPRYQGIAQEYVKLSEEGVAPVPPHLSYMEAAALPCAGLTAWNAVVTRGKVKPGDWVLVQGTGGVSLFALQFAKAAGARVILTSSSDEKLEKGRALGADHTINYKAEPNWAGAALEVTGGRGVDIVVEIGGGETFQQSLFAIRPGGFIGFVGFVSGASAEVLLALINAQSARIEGISIGNREEFEAMTRAIAATGLRPLIDSTYALEDYRAALSALQAQNHMGKIGVEIAA
ncbi:alcohol dehydrogenase [Tepidicaulis marinus]|uniref:Alcohol dehydrogenase n=1 Tax=Tepidicaulis marinus TaxID=1333998 RepID=A0A081B8G5_9HYPH|nr:NAD(P)-dependent alcohol dehydrogenase [Tepidicaulis marinus]GAK44333.1 alcohol dehydrogenase [Tepidicaulis marinus]